MASNSFGEIFRFTTWGESHGAAIGVVIDGCPSLLPLSEADIQPWLDKRKPAQSRFVSQRKESDQVMILSGVFQEMTLGSPINLVIQNMDTRSSDYEDIKDKFRPGHADYATWAKYGIRDYRGGGRASARETACRVAAGAVARKILGDKISIRGALVQLGPHKINRTEWDWNEVQNNPFFCPDPKSVAVWTNYLDEVRESGSSIGAIIEVVASGVPAGWGEPVYGKLNSDIARALMSINAVKGVEIGAGFESAAQRGEENTDEMQAGENAPQFLSNNAGGILGGISTGQDIIARFAVKPTPSIPRPRKTISIDGKNCEITTKGRHDPCVGIRAVPVGEAMLACVLADHFLRRKASRA